MGSHGTPAPTGLLLQFQWGKKLFEVAFVSYGIKLILDDQGNHLDSYAISLGSFRSFRGPLFRKSVTSHELFFAVSYSKPALTFSLFNSKLLNFA